MCFTGVCAEIEHAIQMIRERFPTKRYPQLTLEQVNLHQVIPASNISFIPNNRVSFYSYSPVLKMSNTLYGKMKQVNNYDFNEFRSWT